MSQTALAWTGRTITWLLLAWAWRRLSVAVIPRRWYSVLTAALFACLMERCHMAGEWVIGGVEAKGFAYVLVLLGLEALLRSRWNRALWLFGEASAFHVLVGGWAMVAAAVAWLWLFRAKAVVLPAEHESNDAVQPARLAPSSQPLAWHVRRIIACSARADPQPYTGLGRQSRDTAASPLDLCLRAFAASLGAFGHAVGLHPADDVALRHWLILGRVLPGERGSRPPAGVCRRGPAYCVRRAPRSTCSCWSIAN